MNLDNPQHDDFVVVRRDERFGGFEELKHKDGSAANIQFFRKSVTPLNHQEFDDMLKLQKHIMADNPFGTVYPVYTHDGYKWVLMSIVHEEKTRSSA
ncbi:uncharacterized protein LAESUDRAFT_757643 [Laetiporus sulphureus 93-53]|uniref:Aminoglycoside phosphotransferase domain-containing protein n=1 Tax=Laetiporus sulphureus 93-53 TaxID=1314785 RepID=A0A165F538_9APHY|nr:uncharacterized protein LAESUDRAFT_757643 [Laetiporus sulphureus 93-53]KZT08408.1 hypothetical protein LAESUDRAFT_757643 [Laetiporus sulphureus 93-53]